LFVFINLLRKALDKSQLHKYCKDGAFVVTQFLTIYFSKYFQHIKIQKYVLDVFMLFSAFSASSKKDSNFQFFSTSQLLTHHF
jgi:hypothetical protein